MIELHISTSDNAVKSSCDYCCGIYLHTIDMTSSPAKVSCTGFLTVAHFTEQEG